MKHIQLGLYGEPGVGKSVFAHYAPNRFFITTDANYQYLEEFGAKEEDHIRVRTWNEAKMVINDIMLGKYDKYDTFVVDLLEDLFKWCEYEYCKKNGYEHVSDVGFAKGYDITRTEFIIEISKLLSLENKNVILLMHGLTYTTKDRRGIEHTKHGPSNRLPDKVIDQIEGRVRMFLRCYLKAEDVEGKLIKKRYLSLVPKENEFGIIRGVNENNIPTDIPLDFKTFAETIGLETGSKKTAKKEVSTSIKDIKLDEAKEMKFSEPVKDEKPAESVKDDELPKTLEKPEVKEAKPEPVKVEVVETKAEEPAQPSSNKNAQLAALLAKLGKK
jgi:hypothetical protein